MSRISMVGLAFALCLLCAPSLASAPIRERETSEAEAMYQRLGSQMVCLCGGCRERLIDCSMTHCSFKETALRFLREECKNADLSEDQVRASMVKRFGPELLQVQSDSLLYPVLFASGFVVIALFGAAVWYVSKRGQRQPQEAKGSPTADPALEQRILREMEELE